MEGEAASGDRAVVVVTDDTALVAAIDVLGHGAEAARAAEPAAEILTAFVHEPPGSLLQRCHESLRNSRGAAVTLALISVRDDAMTWTGVGNVAGRLVRMDGAGTVSAESLIPTRGIAGEQLPELEVTTLPLRRGDLLLLATDGIDPGFADSLRPHGTAKEVAARILAEHSKPRDDALVVAARYLGRHE
jgi:phosphoserine phosphatase RsbX